MLIILSAISILVAFVVFSVRIKNVKTQEYETYLCKGAVRASEGIIIGNATVEQIRSALSRSNTKF